MNGARRQEGPDDFWEDLVQEVEQLRDIVKLKPGEADGEIAQSPDPARASSAVPDGGLMVLGLPSYNPSLDSWRSSPSMLPLHKDKVSAHEHPSTNALGAAVCFAAANSMTAGQSRAIFDMEKAIILDDCRKACESAIQKSDLLTTKDITVLQAFVLYLTAKQTGERNRTVWTLIATAVRVAKALRLHLDLPIGNSSCRTFFDQQMQKRLWLTICVLDLQTSLAQASKPLIGLEEVAECLPSIKHINDSDFGLSTVKSVSDRETLTDITFALLKFHLSVFGRHIGQGRTSTSTNVGLQLEWETTQQRSQHFETEILQLVRFCDPESSTYAWFTWHSTQLFVTGGRLAALRPLHRAKVLNHQTPPRMKDETELLQLTLQALEKMKMMHTDPRAEGFRWMVTIQWHILAIAIAECYVCPDQTLVRRAWALIEFLYQRHESLLTRNSGGRLQGPLGKLMRRTREKLASTLDDDPAVTRTRNHQCISAQPLGNASQRSIVDRSGSQPCLDAELNMQSNGTFRRAHQLMSVPETSNGAERSSGMVDMDFGQDEIELDQSWQLWEEFMQDVSFDDLNSPDEHH
ncbi:hypothetical protein TruAng_003123 [Truncatella angustata]|nr:hypothetical protein TruAng_003123 [Truncatella angustata]